MESAVLGDQVAQRGQAGRAEPAAQVLPVGRVAQLLALLRMEEALWAVTPVLFKHHIQRTQLPVRVAQVALVASALQVSPDLLVLPEVLVEPQASYI